MTIDEAKKLAPTITLADFIDLVRDPSIADTEALTIIGANVYRRYGSLLVSKKEFATWFRDHQYEIPEFAKKHQSR